MNKSKVELIDGTEMEVSYEIHDYDKEERTYNLRIRYVNFSSSGDDVDIDTMAIFYEGRFMFLREYVELQLREKIDQDIFRGYEPIDRRCDECSWDM